MNVDDLIEVLNKDKTLQSATYVVNPKKTIRVTRQRKPHGRDRYSSYIVTMGVPNYISVKYIRKMKKDSSLPSLFTKTFPVKRKPKSKPKDKK